jgi:predicted HAD superfamily Cof-like phosphohydrolase
MNYIKMVEEFHTVFKAPILNTPQIPSADRATLRVSLLQEEINELKEAIANNDLVEAFDAFLDIQYVLSGALLEFGLKDIFDEGFAEVQRSNMSKACNSEQEAIDTLEFYKDKDGTEGYYKQDGDLWLVYRSGDDKVLKNKYYSAASLAKFIEK